MSNNNIYTLKATGETKHSARFINEFSNFGIKTKRIHFRAEFNETMTRNVDLYSLKHGIQIIRNIVSTHVNINGTAIVTDYFTFINEHTCCDISDTFEYSIKQTNDKVVIEWSDDFNLSKVLGCDDDRELYRLSVIELMFNGGPDFQWTWINSHLDEINKLDISLDVEVVPINRDNYRKPMNYSTYSRIRTFDGLSTFVVENNIGKKLIKMPDIKEIIYQKDGELKKDKISAPFGVEYEFNKGDTETSTIIFNNPLHYEPHFFIKHETSLDYRKKNDNKTPEMIKKFSNEARMKYGCDCEFRWSSRRTNNHQ